MHHAAAELAGAVGVPSLLVGEEQVRELRGQTKGHQLREWEKLDVKGGGGRWEGGGGEGERGRERKLMLC